MTSIVAKFNPQKCYLHSGKIKNIEDAITIPSKTIYDLGKEFSINECLLKYGEEAIKKMTISQQHEIIKEHYPKSEMIDFLKIWIVELSINMNVKQNLSESQIMFVAERLFSKYSWKITDLTLFFRNIKEGIYGNLYENLSPEKILQWADTYHSERAGIAETLSDQSAPFSVTKDKMHPKVIEAIFKDVGNEDEIKKEEAKPATIFDSYEKHMEYMKSVASVASPEQLISFIQEHFQRSDMSSYVDVFNGYLSESKDPRHKKFHDMVWEASVKFEDFTRKGSDDSKQRYEELSKEILNFKL